MQKIKYFFSLAVLLISLVGVLGGLTGVDVVAANDCCINTLVSPVSCDPCNAAGTNCITDPTAASLAGVPVCPGIGSCTSSQCTPTTPPVGTSSTSTTIPNPITSNTVKDVLDKLLAALSSLVITLAIIFIVLGGILYMLSTGDPGMIKRAKDCWLFSVIGLAIVVAAPTFLKEVMNILGKDSVGTDVEEAYTISQIATNVLNLLLSVVGIIAIISLVVAGGMYMTAYGEDEQMKTAKKMGTWAVVGIAVALGSLVIVKQVAKLIAG
jgi:hypothetical protein